MADPTPPPDRTSGPAPTPGLDGGRRRPSGRRGPLRRLAPLLVVLVAVALLVVVAVISPFESTEPALDVREAYVGASTDPAGAYLVIANGGGSDDLTAVHTDLGVVTLQRRVHDEITDQDVLQEATSLRVPGYTETRLQPGDDQLLVAVTGEPPEPGSTVTLRLEFRTSDPITVEAEVLSYEDIGTRMLPPLLTQEG